MYVLCVCVYVAVLSVKLFRFSRSTLMIVMKSKLFFIFNFVFIFNFSFVVRLLDCACLPACLPACLFVVSCYAVLCCTVLPWCEVQRCKCCTIAAEKEKKNWKEKKPSILSVLLWFSWLHCVVLCVCVKEKSLTMQKKAEKVNGNSCNTVANYCGHRCNEAENKEIESSLGIKTCNL